MPPAAPAIRIDNATVYREACKRFLPTTREEMKWRGWDELDVLLVNGDAYVDHPTFGIPCLGRYLEKMGLRVGIVSQPKWDSPRDLLVIDRKSTRLNSSHSQISYAVFCLKKK